MHYITLDLEWNQAYAQKALAVQRQLACRLRGEVIQIGAVKLDERMRICGSYQIIVKPKYYKKLHRHVSELTGITQEQMDMGTPLDEASERFRKWCGRDFAFLTWGPDDIPMLKENLNANGLRSDWLNRAYDLQVIFNKQTDGLSKQRSLEYAMDYFELQQNLPAHDALNDAYFTTLVAQRLDIPRGVKEYDTVKGEYLLDTVVGDADAGDDGYVTIGELLEDTAVTDVICPLCKKKLVRKGRQLHSKGQKYTLYLNCERDGDMFLTLKLHKNFNETWRARRILTRASAEEILEYKSALERGEIRRKASRHRRRRPSRRPAKEKIIKQ